MLRGKKGLLLLIGAVLAEVDTGITSSSQHRQRFNRLHKKIGF